MTTSTLTTRHLAHFRGRRVRGTLARLGFALLSVWGAATIVFVITRLSGDPARLMSPAGAGQDQIDATSRYFGLDESIVAQYASYLGGLLHGSFGESFYWRQDAGSVVFGHLLATLELAVVSFILTLLVAVPAAVLAAHRVGGWVDRLLTGAAGIGIAVPQFWLGPLLIIGFAVNLKMVPASGGGGPAHYVLPVATLAAVQIAILFILARAALAKQLHETYVEQARAKGARGARVMIVHVLPNAGLEILTVSGLVLANLIAGDIIVESVFAWPGIGQLLTSSVMEYDFPVIQALTLIYSVAFIGILLVVDSLYRVIDPRT